jgi:hypothetical protein
MDIREQMMVEHQNVENLLGEIKHVVLKNDPRLLCEAWRRFERDLEDHLRFEERQLLTPFSQVNPTEAAALRAEHEEIRRRIGELGIGTDLHLVRAETVDQLIAQLRAHGEREDRTLYVWAMEHLPAETIERIWSERVRELVSRRLDEMRVQLHLLRLDVRDEVAEIHREADKLGREAAHTARQSYEHLLDRLRQIAAPPD